MGSELDVRKYRESPSDSGASGDQTLGPFTLNFDDVLVAGQSHLQTLTITGSPGGGDFTLHDSLDVGTPIGPIAYNADAAAVQAALAAYYGADLISVTGANPGPFTVGTTYDGLLVLDTNGLTGGSSPSVAIAQVQPYVAKVFGKQLYVPTPGHIVKVGYVKHLTAWDTVAANLRLGSWLDAGEALPGGNWDLTQVPSVEGADLTPLDSHEIETLIESASPICAKVDTSNPYTNVPTTGAALIWLFNQPFTAP